MFIGILFLPLCLTHTDFGLGGARTKWAVANLGAATDVLTDRKRCARGTGSIQHGAPHCAPARSEPEAA
ncbi:hypothetical protein MYBA111488_18980 [Mycobacterium basiliense]